MFWPKNLWLNFLRPEMKTNNKQSHKITALSLEIILLTAVLLFFQILLFPSSADAASREGGFLAKSGDSPAVYFISANNYKLAIPSARIFLSYRYRWSQVRIVSDAELDSYPKAKYISENSSAAIYFLNKDEKRYVTQASASALGIKPEEIVSVNRVEFRSYAVGPRLEELEAKQLAASVGVSGSENFGVAAEKCVPNPDAGGEDGCLLYDASSQNNPDLCGQIKNRDYLPSCYGMFEAPTGTPAVFYCNQIADKNLNEICIGKVALRKKDAGLCDSIPTPANKNQCLAGVGMSVGDLDKCSLLPPYSAASPNAASQETCVYIYAVLNTSSPACEKIPKTSPFYEACLKFSKPSQATP